MRQFLVRIFSNDRVAHIRVARRTDVFAGDVFCFRETIRLYLARVFVRQIEPERERERESLQISERSRQNQRPFIKTSQRSMHLPLDSHRAVSEVIECSRDPGEKQSVMRSRVDSRQRPRQVRRGN